MNLKSVAVALLILPLSVTARAITPVDPNSALQNAGSFAMGGIGIAGTMSAGERALRQILAQPDAVSRLEGMFSNASSAGKLYALLGLRKLDRSAYERAVEKVRSIDGEVGTAHGCILSRENFRDLLKQIEQGHYDAQLAREWPDRSK